MVLTVSGISAVSGVNSRYEVLSIYGNPISAQPVEAVDSNSSRNSALISVAPEIKDVTAEEQQSEPARRVVSGSYADIMKMQDLISNPDDNNESGSEVGNVLNDMKNKMMVGIDTDIPGRFDSASTISDVNEVSDNDSDKLVRDSQDKQLEDSQLEYRAEDYNRKKMISAYETTLMFAS